MQNTYNSGCSGLAPFGTTGEAMSISTAERRLALEGLVGSGIDPSVLIQDRSLQPASRLNWHNKRQTLDVRRYGLHLLFKDVSEQGLLDY